MTNRKAGRPTKAAQAKMKSDAKKFVSKMAESGCSITEIAEVMNISRHTFYNNYLDLYKEGRAKMKISLRKRALDRAFSADGKGDMILKKLLEKYLDDMDDEITINHKDKLNDINDEELVEIMINSNGKIRDIKDQ